MYGPRLKCYYESTIFFELFHKLRLNNYDEVPKFEKCIISLTSPKILNDSEGLLTSLLTVEWITGQRGKITNAHTSLASLKLRKGMELGSKVTLRGEKMYLFLDYIFLCVLPNLHHLGENLDVIYNFGNFDVNANFSFGIPEVFLFPQLSDQHNNLNKVVGLLKGLNITLICSSNNYNYNQLLLSSLQIPFLNLKVTR